MSLLGEESFKKSEPARVPMSYYDLKSSKGKENTRPKDLVINQSTVRAPLKPVNQTADKKKKSSKDNQSPQYPANHVPRMSSANQTRPRSPTVPSGYQPRYHSPPYHHRYPDPGMYMTSPPMYYQYPPRPQYYAKPYHPSTRGPPLPPMAAYPVYSPPQGMYRAPIAQHPPRVRVPSPGAAQYPAQMQSGPPFPQLAGAQYIPISSPGTMSPNALPATSQAPIAHPTPATDAATHAPTIAACPASGDTPDVPGAPPVTPVDKPAVQTYTIDQNGTSTTVTTTPDVYQLIMHQDAQLKQLQQQLHKLLEAQAQSKPDVKAAANEKPEGDGKIEKSEVEVLAEKVEKASIAVNTSLLWAPTGNQCAVDVASDSSQPVLEDSADKIEKCDAPVSVDEKNLDFLQQQLANQQPDGIDQSNTIPANVSKQRNQPVTSIQTVDRSVNNRTNQSGTSRSALDQSGSSNTDSLVFSMHMTALQDQSLDTSSVSDIIVDLPGYEYSNE